jgi:hypothetical protein
MAADGAGHPDSVSLAQHNHETETDTPLVDPELGFSQFAMSKGWLWQSGSKGSF